MSKRVHIQFAKLAKKYRLKLLYLFGSRARGDERRDSDLDLAFLASAPLNKKTYANFFAEMLKITAPYNLKIDLVDLSAAPPLLGYMIAREGKKIFGAEKDDEKFYRFAMERYIDAKPLFDLTKHYVRSQINV